MISHNNFPPWREKWLPCPVPRLGGPYKLQNFGPCSITRVLASFWGAGEVCVFFVFFLKTVCRYMRRACDNFAQLYRIIWKSVVNHVQLFRGPLFGSPSAAEMNESFHQREWRKRMFHLAQDLNVRILCVTDKFLV